MVRLDAEVKQITHAIRMAAYNAETLLAEPWMATTPAPATRPTLCDPRSPHRLRRHLPW
jgi:hypothetical protein